MTPRRFTEEQIIGILREQVQTATADFCRKHGISEAIFYNWKAKYGELEVSEAKRLKGLESEKRQAEEAPGRRHARRRREGSESFDFPL